MARNRARRGRPGRLKQIRRSWLGLLTLVGLLVLVGAYLAVLEYSRPHVDGDRLRFDTYVRLVASGRVQDATILDEDAFVVGTYVAPEDLSDLDDVDLGNLDLAPGDSHGGAIVLPGTGAGDLPVSPTDGPVRQYNAPLVRGTQGAMLELLVTNAVPITIDQQVGKRVATLASFLLPGLILTILFVYLLISYRRGSGLFGIRSGARRFASTDTDVMFSDIAGQDAAVTELRDIKEFLTDPERFGAVGAAVPKGVLLYGPPGCGKTMLAKALAGEAAASFYSISGSDFVEVYVGVGAARVRDLFKEARANVPSVIFIDELDSIGRARGVVGSVASHGEQEQALNQILAEMDGFSTSEGILVVGATNRPDILDQALLRPGRFDRTVGLERPGEAARLAILSVHAKTKPLDAGIDLPAVAKRAIGLTGADLASVMNEGALLAARHGRRSILQADLDLALQRVLEAPERQRRLSMRERSIGTRFSSEDKVTFAGVAGVDDAIEELNEIKDYLAEPERFERLGARAPRGVLLTGPPGCGKTLLARAVAGEANAAFISVAASEFVEVYVGVGASRVRELFAEARSIAPAIVFIDEIDAIGSKRGLWVGGPGERDQTLNQILVELDGFDSRSAIIVMAATNRPDILDPALVRPGRFDRTVTVTVPDRAGRRAILDIHAEGKALGPDADLDAIAGLTRGFSGADLANVLNEAALLAARRDSKTIPMALLDEALDRAYLGVSSRGTMMSDEERTIVAYHEAGHALVGRAMPGSGAPHKITIAPRGATLGWCTKLDPHDRTMYTRSGYLDIMASLLGGWAAEELVFGEPGSGSSNDLERVDTIARQMVCDLGMSRGGPRVYTADKNNPPYAPSEEDARTVSTEIGALIEEALVRARSVLTASRAALDRVAAALLEHETIDALQLEQLADPAIVAPRHEQAT